MPDITSVGKRVRDYLRELGIDQVEIGMPQFDGAQWYVLITVDTKMLGTIVLDYDANVIKKQSYPN